LIRNFFQVRPPNQDSVDPEVIIQKDDVDLDLEEFERNVSNLVGTSHVSNRETGGGDGITSKLQKLLIALDMPKAKETVESVLPDEGLEAVVQDLGILV
jgi:hypothetical protein